MTTTPPPPEMCPVVYRIKVEGTVEPRWSECFHGLNLAVELDREQKVFTTITGPVPDQAALRGILNKLWDMNVKLISVEQITGVTQREASDDR